MMLVVLNHLRCLRVLADSGRAQPHEFDIGSLLFSNAFMKGRQKVQMVEMCFLELLRWVDIENWRVLRWAQTLEKAAKT